eukprot:scaffold268502_cov16-Prasinocladus_malaysianus.AAC.1
MNKEEQWRLTIEIYNAQMKSLQQWQQYLQRLSSLTSPAESQLLMLPFETPLLTLVSARDGLAVLLQTRKKSDGSLEFWPSTNANKLLIVHYQYLMH